MANRRELPATAHCVAFAAYNHERCMAANFARAVESSNYAYSRALPAGSQLYVVAYGYDRHSPTGVSRMASCLNFDEAVAIMDAAGKPFPLSPVEGLNKSGAHCAN